MLGRQVLALSVHSLAFRELRSRLLLDLQGQHFFVRPCFKPRQRLVVGTFFCLDHQVLQVAVGSGGLAVGFGGVHVVVRSVCPRDFHNGGRRLGLVDDDLLCRRRGLVGGLFPRGREFQRLSAVRLRQDFYIGLVRKNALLECLGSASFVTTLALMVVVVLVVMVVMLVRVRVVVALACVLVTLVSTVPAFVVVHVQMMPVIFFSKRGVGFQLYVGRPAGVSRSSRRFE